MSNLKDMSLRKITDKIGLPIKDTDIRFFCNDYEIIDEFLNITSNGNIDEKGIEFLIKHEDKMNKSKFILISLYNCQKSLEDIDQNLNIVKDYLSESNAKNNIRPSILSRGNLYDSKIEVDILKARITSTLSTIQSMGQGINTTIADVIHDEKANKYKLLVIDSNELINGVKKQSSKNENLFRNIDEAFKEYKTRDKEKSYGFKMILCSLFFSDVEEIFVDREFGYNVLKMLLDNEIMKEQGITLDCLEKTRLEHLEKYTEWRKNVKFRNLLPELEKVIKENIQYVKIDKLLLISAYRFQQVLEQEMIKGEDTIDYKDVFEKIKKILDDMKCTNKVYPLHLQVMSKNPNVSDRYQTVEYSTKDIKNCLSRYTSKGFISIEHINKVKEDIKTGKITLNDINDEEIDKIFSKKELEEIATQNDENFIYVFQKLNWEKENIINKLISKGNCSDYLLDYFISEGTLKEKDIIDLYMKSIVTLEQIENLGERVDLSSKISAQRLNELYIKNKQGNENENTESEYDRYLALYKQVSQKWEKESKEEHSNILLEQIVEQIDGKKINKYLEEYFVQGVITADTIRSWCGIEKMDELTLNCYQKKLINLDNIKELINTGNISTKIIERIVTHSNTNYEQRMAIINEGVVPEDIIFSMFRQNLIYRNDLEELSKHGIIDERNMKKCLNGLELKQLEANSGIVLEIGDGLQKIQIDNSIYSNNNSRSNQKKQEKIIIDPNEREMFFSLFGAVKPGKIRINSDSPFYNYEFYIIPDEENKISPESVVIAERIYEEKLRNDCNSNTDYLDMKKKQTQKLTFATNNATYFFQYGDLMVLSNYLKKDDVIDEKANTVFKVNHNLATERARRILGNRFIICYCKNNDFVRFKTCKR